MMAQILTKSKSITFKTNLTCREKQGFQFTQSIIEDSMRQIALKMQQGKKERHIEAKNCIRKSTT